MSAPLVSIITTCKGRLPHLQQTLPLMLNQSNSEVIVVDYSCPQKTADWVNENHPSVRTIVVDDVEKFNVSHARNIGASHAKGEWLLFVDADIFLQTDLCDWLSQHGKHGSFYCTGNPDDGSTHGTVICPKKGFDEVGGYDEVFTHWGGEDTDLYNMLHLLNYKKLMYPADAIEAIVHGDEERGLLHSRLLSFTVNQTYRNIKMDICRLTGSRPDYDNRRFIFESIKKQLITRLEANDPKSCSLEVNLPGKSFARQIRYTFAPVIKRNA